MKYEGTYMYTSLFVLVCILDSNLGNTATFINACTYMYICRLLAYIYIYVYIYMYIYTRTHRHEYSLENSTNVYTHMRIIHKGIHIQINHIQTNTTIFVEKFNNDNLEDMCMYANMHNFLYVCENLYDNMYICLTHTYP